MLVPINYNRFKELRGILKNPYPSTNSIVPNSNNLKTVSPDIINDPPPPSEKTGILDFVKNNSADIRSLAGLAANTITANRLQSQVPTRVVLNRPFTYRDRTSTLQSNNMAGFRNYLRNRTGLPVNANQAYAATLEANNKIAALSGESQDRALESFNSRDMQVNATNVDCYNRNLYLNSMLKNNKITQQGNAFTNYLMNLDTNELQKNQVERDNKAIDLMGLGLSYGRNSNILKSIMEQIGKIGK